MSEATRVAVVIPAKDEADTIAATVRACRAIPRVNLVLVVDDG
ncbi:MAG: glycosyltransferase, partial [Actinomycetes bacterium]|nr:glycosyltransferase [Actinomycetes bacterium]